MRALPLQFHLRPRATKRARQSFPRRLPASHTVLAAMLPCHHHQHGAWVPEQTIFCIESTMAGYVDDGAVCVPGDTYKTLVA
jgi:hypothetical protein